MRIFISYALVDGIQYADLLEAAIHECGFTPFLDRSDITGGQDWARIIEQAIDQCDILLALITVGSNNSNICRGEHLRALRKGKRVIPVKLGKSMDLPVYLEASHYLLISPDFTAHDAILLVKKILAHNKGAKLPQAFQTPKIYNLPIPGNAIRRSKLCDSLTKELLSAGTAASRPMICISGMAGSGKSWLVNTVCLQEMVQHAFSDGIIWIDVGNNLTTGDIIDRLMMIGSALGDNLDHYQSLTSARFHLREKLSRGNLLIVFDDVWDDRILRGLSNASPGLQIVYTTRNQSIALATGSKNITVGPMEDGEALQTLRLRSGSDDPDYPEITQRVGNLPLALNIIAARVPGEISGAAWLQHFTRISQLKLGRNAVTRETNVYKSFELSYEMLGEDQQALQAIGIFSKGILLNKELLGRLFRSVLPGLSVADSLDLIAEFTRLSFIHDTGDRYRIHALIHDFALDKAGNNLILYHKQFLSSYVLDNDYLNINDDGYIFKHIAHHLSGIAELPLLRNLLLDYSWLLKQITNAGPAAAINSCKYFPGDPLISKLQDLLRFTSPALARFPGELITQLITYRLADPLGTLGGILFRWEFNTPAMEEIYQFPAEVTSIAISRNGRRAIAGSLDSFSAWDLNGPLPEQQNGKCVIFELPALNEIYSLDTWMSKIYSVALDPNASVGASAGKTGVLVWDITGNLKEQIEVDIPDSIPLFSVSTETGYVVAADSQGHVMRWNTENGKKESTIHLGREIMITACGFSHDQDILYMIDEEGSIYFININTTTIECIQEQTPGYYSSRLDPANGLALTWCKNGTIRVYNLHTRKQYSTLTGKTIRARAAAVDATGQYVAAVYIENLKGELFFFDSNTRKVLTRKSCGARVWDLQFTPDSTALLLIEEYGALYYMKLKDSFPVRCISMDSGKNPHPHVLEKGKSVLIKNFNGELSRWDIAHEQCLWKVRFSEPADTSFYIDTAENIVVTSGQSIQVRSLDDGHQLTGFTPEHSCYSGAMSANGTIIAAFDSADFLHILRIHNRKE